MDDNNKRGLELEVRGRGAGVAGRGGGKRQKTVLEKQLKKESN